MRARGSIGRIVGGVAVGVAALVGGFVAQAEAEAEQVRSAVLRPMANLGMALSDRHPADARPARLTVGGTQRNVAYLRFQVPKGASDGDASLLLFATSSVPHGLKVRAVDETVWRPKTARWSAGVRRNQASIPRADSGTWVSIDVSKLVKGRSGVVSLAISGPDAHHVTFVSRLSSLRGPRLVVWRSGKASVLGPGPKQLVPSSDRFGIASAGGKLQFLEPDELDRALDDIASSGATWVRFDLNWADIQADGPDSFNWARYDRVIDGAHRRGLKVLPVVAYTPPWARPAGLDTDKAPPARIEDFTRFVAVAVARYSSRGVRHWQIWNEPNIAQFWEPGPDPTRYVKLLRGSYAAIKGIDPGATVVMGGLAPAPDDSLNMSGPTFMRLAYAAGAHGAFDAAASHPYSFPVLPSYPDPNNAWQQLATTKTSLRQLMIENGDADKLIWMTEFGAPSDGPVDQRVTLADQARILDQAYRLNMTYPWAGPLFWYSYADLGTSTDTRENHFGLVRFDGSAKPALDVYRRRAEAAKASAKG